MDELRVATELDTTQYIVIKIGDESYGINIAFVDNIVRMQHITRVPKVASHIKGVINLRGIVVPVMSLRLKMGLEEDVITKATRIIILKLETQGTVGIIVDEVREVITLDSEHIEKVAQDSTKSPEHVNFVSAVGKTGDELVSLLDLNTITLENE
ncbi:MAG: chemotaxis protein CheW [Lachnospiraceae bacterium]|nr:chemotaxis protein CheW [Lachnospiraceae bacterium]MCR4678544.1 chemotaxis protein CheW [Lachnospiraceae bacterium]